MVALYGAHTAWSSHPSFVPTLNVVAVRALLLALLEGRAVSAGPALVLAVAAGMGGRRLLRQKPSAEDFQEARDQLNLGCGVLGGNTKRCRHRGRGGGNEGAVDS